MSIIGADEVGSGDTFCGVVVSAICINDHQRDLLKKKRIRDCKRISDNRIGEYVALLSQVGARHSTIAITPDEINDLTSRLGSHVDIQNTIYSKAIANLIEKVGNPDRIIIDRYPGADIKVDHQDVDMIPRADEEFLSVAAASIMARSAYLGMKKSLQRELGMEIPLGSSNTKQVLRTLINRRIDISRYAKLYPNNVQAVLRERGSPEGPKVFDFT